ncbi:MAG TPA: peptidyl-prolyl cis-trans isomerase [Phycisphaerales bacterium]|nr:peptidyl-prolyl cis-trans isomerase [Phycisphaerales bacterium]
MGDPPAAPAAGASPVGHDVVADSMVGQIQGRPVYASEVLTPLDGRLRQLSKDVRTPADLAAWVNGATKVIADVVKERVNDEVALSEARSRLTPEQKQGLVYFLQRVDQWATGQAGGSRAQAEEAIRAREGEEFDKYLQITRDKTLIQELVKDNVGPNVRVPWRRVERYYADNQASINPPPYGVVRVLMVDGGNAERLAKAEAAAKEPSGEAFRELATSAANEFRASDRVSGKEIKDGLIIRPIDAKPFEQQEWVGNPAWNRAASTLKPGEVAGPIEAGTYRVFIRREADFVSPHRSLEDAQLEIYAGLLQLKSQQEQNEFYTQLRGKGSFTPVRQMTFELLVLAAQRHLPPEMSGAVRSSFEGEFKTDAVLERSPAPPVLDDMSINPSPGAAPPK